MMFRKLKYPFLVFLLTVFALQINSASDAATKRSSVPAQLLSKADQSRKSLLASAAKMKNRENWLNCISKYQDIYEKYPESEQAAWALYHGGGLYRKLYKYSHLEEDLDNALSLFERLSNEYKDHRLADDAQYERGEIYYQDKNDLTQAYVEFLKLDLNFTSGDMKPKGKEIMDEISLALGKEEEAKQETVAAISNGLVSIKGIRKWSTPTYTRVVIDADAPVKYSSPVLLKEDKSLNKPRRLYIDLENSRVSSEIKTDITIEDGLLKGARAGQYNSSTVRVVLDIESILDTPKIFTLYDPFRIVIDVQGAGSAGKEAETQTSSSASTSSTRAPRKGIYKPDGADENVSLAGQLGLSVRRIVIDPGHGGKDPGTQLNGNIQEKDITLELAKKLKAKIEKEIGCEVLLTRDKDVSIPLEARTGFANENKADLFISLHVNAHKKSSVYGLETYFLNMATDENAVLVAARENATSEKNISDLQSILNDLMLNTKISESSKLAYKVQNGMMSNIKKTYKVRKDLGVKQAPFYVLIGAEMPAILVEIGFITNPTEKKRILNDAYKNLLADGITSGIKAYKDSIEQAAFSNTGG